MKNISAWSIRHPIPSIVLFMVLLSAGIIGYSKMAMDENPNIDLPNVSVTVSLNGAAPAELEIQVTRKIEDALAGLNGIRHITSTISEGSSSTSIEFELGTNTDRAVNDIRDRITRIRSELPGEISEPVVQRMDVTGNTFATYVISCPSMNSTQLSWFVDNELSRALLSVQGVGQVQRSGGVDREIEIELSPTKLESVGLTAEDVSTQIKNGNVNMPGGRGELNRREQSIRTVGSSQTIEDLKAMKIALKSSAMTRLDQLGTIRDAHADPRQFALFDNKPVVAFSLRRTPGSGLAQVAELADKKLLDMKRSLPTGMKIEKVRTNATYVRDSFDATIEAMILGALLAVFTIWFFLRDWRSAIISAVAMPLSVVPTFWVMHLLNFTMNNISLLGLALVVGILVDDAIVEIENIVRHIQIGKTARRAALEAADEIGLAVVATTFSIIAVFVPVGFMSGIPGQFFKQFGITVAVSVFFSLIVARLITPMMCAALLSDDTHESETNRRFVAIYKSALLWALDHRKKTVAASIVFFAVSVALAATIPTNFMGTADRSEILMTAQLEPGARLDKSIDVAKRLATQILKRPEVAHVFTSVGTPTESKGPSRASPGATVNRAELYIVLKPRSERGLSQSELETKLREEIRPIAGVKAKLSASQGIGGRLQYCLAGNNPKELTTFAAKLVSEIRGLKGLADVDTDASTRAPQIKIEPNRELTAQQGITVQSIAHTALVATLGDSDANLGKFDLPDRQLDVRVTLNHGARQRLNFLKSLKVTGTSGNLVPLGSVAKIEISSGPSEITRYDRQRQVTISAQLVGGKPLGQALQEVRRLPANKTRPSSVSELLTGDVQIQSEIFGSFGTALFAAVLLIYCVLALLFNNLLHPFTIMVSLPLSLGGAVAALLVFRQPMGLYAVIGIVMLMGVVAKNAILLVEYALIAVRDEHISATEAVIKAGETRMRPILMTTFAMVAGMAPIALGIGAGAELRAPMAVTVIGGLATSSFLTLIVVPTIFVMFDQVFSKRTSDAVKDATPVH